MKQSVKVDLGIPVRNDKSTVEVIEKSKAISDIGLEIQTLNNAYANHAKAMSETMEKIKELKAKQDELARNLIQECNKPLTVDDLDINV